MQKYLAAAFALLVIGFGVVAEEGGPAPQPIPAKPTSAPPPVTFQKPGPSQWLFDHPYYTCTRNFYVATNGSNSNSGTMPDSPWLTLQRANYGALVAGDCVNVAPGTYRNSVNLTKGGNNAAANGYVTYRCTQLTPVLSPTLVQLLLFKEQAHQLSISSSTDSSWLLRAALLTVRVLRFGMALVITGLRPTISG